MNTETDNKTTRIAQLLSNLMRLFNLTQGELAERWGVSPATVSKIMAGDRQSITLESAQMLIDAFGIDPGMLFEEKGSK